MPEPTEILRNDGLAARITLITSAALLIIMLALGWIVHSQASQALQQQADAIGETLIQQTARAAVTALATEDTLGLNILLRELTNNTYVSYAAVYDINSNQIAQAGSEPRNPGDTLLYSHELTFQRVLAGTLHIRLDLKKLQQPLHKGLQSIFLLAALLLLLVAAITYRLARTISKPLRSLSFWLEHPLAPAPYVERKDEIGLLARQINQLIAKQPEPNQLDVAASPPTSLTPEAITITQPVATLKTDQLTAEQNTPAPSGNESTHLDITPLPQGSITAKAVTQNSDEEQVDEASVLAVQLNLSHNSHFLAEPQLQKFHSRYWQALQRAASIYQAQLKQLEDGRTLLIFSSRKHFHIRNAICCGELLRAFAHSLQIDIADSSVSVSMQLGLAQGITSNEQDDTDAALQEITNKALNLCSHSRNLLLVCQSLANDRRAQACARIRNIVRPQGVSCVEALLAPHLAKLDQQLQCLRHSYEQETAESVENS